MTAAACAAEPAAEATARSPAAAVAPVAPKLVASRPEPGVALEPVEVVTPTGTHRFQAEIADDFEERRRGLMFRETLAEDRAMLFLFEGPPQPLGFWMKNTPRSLDILYLQADGTVVSIAKNTIPFAETVLPAAGPASAVLEINGGLSDRLGIAPGDKVRHRALTGD